MALDNQQITPVLLAGGKGTRLRPLTSNTRPKPFVKFLSTHSMFQNTLQRFANYQAPVIVTHKRYLGLAEQDLDALGMNAQAIIAEPSHQSTAAAIACAAIELEGLDTLMLISPTDQVISDDTVLQDIIQKSHKGGLTLIGAQPTYPATRYGYIQMCSAGQLLGFHEKPDQQTARSYISSGQYLWNTGMFLCAPSYFLSLVERSAPAVYAYARKAMTGAKTAKNIVWPEEASYQSIPNLAVDYAVMERLEAADVRALEAGWSDIGSWPAYAKFLFSKQKRYAA